MSSDLHLRYPRRHRSVAYREDFLSRERQLKASAIRASHRRGRNSRKRRFRL